MRSVYRGELLSADDLAIVIDLLAGLKRKLKLFKEALGSKELGANVKKKKIIIISGKLRRNFAVLQMLGA